MTPEQWDRLKSIFHAALQHPAGVRAAWVEQACADDAVLLREAQALLSAHDTAGDLLSARHYLKSRLEKIITAIVSSVAT